MLDEPGLAEHARIFDPSLSTGFAPAVWIGSTVFLGASRGIGYKLKEVMG
jgi:hypothetical protein